MEPIHMFIAAGCNAPDMNIDRWLTEEEEELDNRPRRVGRRREEEPETR